MTGPPKKLGELATALEHEGADPKRVDLVRRAQRFKRSWVEMAEALVRARDRELYREWGYEDFHTYCSQELQLRRTTADKLTMSYRALARHAPERLDPHEATDVPSYEAVGYFAKALGMEPDNEHRLTDGERRSAENASADSEQDPVVDQLRQAVFEEQAPVSSIRRRFDPVLYPKPAEAEELERLRKTYNATKRLASLLENTDELPRETVIRVEDALETLKGELEEAIPAIEKRLQSRAAG